MCGSFPQWRRVDPESGPSRIQGIPGLVRVQAPQSTAIDRSDLIVGVLRLTINQCQYW